MCIFTTLGLTACQRNTLNDSANVDIKNECEEGSIPPEKKRLEDKKLCDFETAAQKIVSQMSLTEKLYQVCMLSVSGKSENEIAAQSFRYPPGAVILFKFNFASEPEAVHRFIGAYEKSFLRNYDANTEDTQTGTYIAPFFATDNEGGKVFRTAEVTTHLPYAFDTARYFSVSEAKNLYTLEAIQLHELRVSMNLAPVCETGDAENGILGKRYFSAASETTSDYAVCFVQSHQDQNIACVLKHFPGSGTADTHRGVSMFAGTYEDLLHMSESFREPLKTASAVMVSHVVVPCLGDKAFCLSAAGIDFLRKEFHYSGIIMSDDIIMKALQPYAKNYSELAYTALMAGCDMILYSAPDFNRLIDNLTEKAQNDPAFEKRLDEAVRTILVGKLKIGLFDTHENGKRYKSEQSFNAEKYYEAKTKAKAILKAKNFDE